MCHVDKEITENGAFLYPDVRTALDGEFDNNHCLIKARAAKLTSFEMDSFGILVPKLETIDGSEVEEYVGELEGSYSETICSRPLLEDPYESKTVQVKPSNIQGAGEGIQNSPSEAVQHTGSWRRTLCCQRH